MKIITASLLVLAFTLLGCDYDISIPGKELDAHIRIHKAVKEAMGFDLETDYKGRGPFSGIAIVRKIVPGKAMDKAGLKVGDHIRCKQAKFYELIVFNQGKEATIPIGRDKQYFDIIVSVPNLNLRDDPAKLHWYFHKHKE